jgi:hypothetical protein
MPTFVLLVFVLAGRLALALVRGWHTLSCCRRERRSRWRRTRVTRARGC